MLWWVCPTTRLDFGTLGHKAKSNGVPRREGFLHKALERGCIASMFVSVEQYDLQTQYALRQAAGRIRTCGIEAVLHDLITQGSYYITQPHGQHGIIKNIILPYVQNTNNVSDERKEWERTRIN